LIGQEPAAKAQGIWNISIDVSIIINFFIYCLCLDITTIVSVIWSIFVLNVLEKPISSAISSLTDHL
jgi:hypothetical protein